MLNAQLDGSSTPKESADQSLINAELGLPLVTAKLAIQDMLSLKDNVFKIQIHSFQLPTIFVQFGVVESVFNVLIEPISIQMEFVHKFQLNAPHGML